MGGEIGFRLVLEMPTNAQRDHASAKDEADANHHRKDVGADLLAGHGRQARAAIGCQAAKGDHEQACDAIGKLHARGAQYRRNVRDGYSERGPRTTRAPSRYRLRPLGEAGGLHGHAHRLVAVIHELGEARTVGPLHAEAAVAHEVAELRRLVDLLEGGGERGGDVGRQALGRRKAAPGAGGVVDAHRLLERRHVLERRVALGGHDGEAARLAGFDDGPRFRNRAGDEIEAVGRQVLHGRRRAVGGHPGHVIGLQAHGLQPADQRQMPDAALARAGRLQLAGRRRLDGVGQVLDRLVGAAGRHLDAGRVLVHEGERRVAVRLQLGEALPVHHRDLDRDDAERVAVGRRGGDGRVADHARAAGAVDDVEGLLELLLEHGRDDARRRIGAAAGAPRTDHGDRTVRPGLGARRPQSERRGGAGRATSDQEVAASEFRHYRFLLEFLFVVSIPHLQRRTTALVGACLR